jgi:CHAD domain-containing protein
MRQQKLLVRRPPDIAAVLSSSLTQRWQKYLKELRRCKRAFSEDAVHDVRVATRRLMSTLMMIELLLPDRRVARVRRRLKRLFDALSPLRDTQVQLLALESKAVQYPELETLLTVLKLRERIAMAAATRRIQKTETAPTGRLLGALKQSLREHYAAPAMRRIGMEVLLGTAASRFMTAQMFAEQARKGTPHAIHRARIAFKKFRYTREALLPLVPATSKNELKAMDEYQTRMGNVQDAEVLSGVLRHFERTRPLASRRKLAPFRRELAALKKELIATYKQRAAELQKFWKPIHTYHR